MSGSGVAVGVLDAVGVLETVKMSASSISNPPTRPVSAAVPVTEFDSIKVNGDKSAKRAVLAADNDASAAVQAALPHTNTTSRSAPEFRGQSGLET